MAFDPTEEQKAIIATAQQRKGSIMVEAGAGCAKTTTLELAAKGIKTPALALAFNKTVATEMKGRFAGNFEVKTMNGLGHMAWARANPSIPKLELDDRKLGKLVTAVAKDRKVDLSSDQWDSLRQLVTKAQQQGLVPQSDRCAAGTIIPDDREGWQSLAEDIGLFPDDFDLIWELGREVLERDIALARNGIISFDDQIYCSTMLGGRFPRFPVTLVDEDQDLNMMNIKMLQLATATEGRLFAVGDKRQSIYGFRGAEGDAAGLIRLIMPEASWTDLPLMTTFRCPKSIVARQQRHVPGYRAHTSNLEGTITHFLAPNGSAEDKEEWPGWNFSDVKRAAEDSSEAPEGREAEIAILCRNNGPLLTLAFKLLRQGVGCHMLGRDIGKGLDLLSKKLFPDGNTPRLICEGKIKDWRESECALARANDKPEKVAGITDRAECLLAVLEGASCRDAGQLRDQLVRLFSRTSGQVTLSSIHRAKGKEWDCVVHLDPWRVPSRQAKREAAEGRYRQLEQELNIKYVCETRTRNILILASVEDYQ